KCFAAFKSSKKGSKLSKAQAAKLQQEEEERRLQEEVDCLVYGHMGVFSWQDQERREDELNELRHLLEENHTAVTKWKTAAMEMTKWERYMRCDGSPDPAVHQDINTYICLWRDDPEVNITPVLKQCNLALQLIEELEVLLRDATHPQEGQKYQEALINLQELIHLKLHLTTEEIFKRASANIDTETGNMQTVIKDDNVTLCFWANLKKNPRFKGLCFEEAGLGFELPKQLAVSDIAVRILHTRYDHLSLLARIAHLRLHSHRYSSDSALTTVNTEQTKAEEEVKEDNETQQHRVDEDVQSIQGSEGRKLFLHLFFPFSSDEGDLSSPPVELSMMDCVQVVDLMQYTPLGGVLFYDVFHLPPQAHQANGWEIRQLLDKGLQVFPYPVEKSKVDDNESLTCPPVGVSVTLPDSVVFLETPQVARWDAAGKQWRMDGITDISYEEAEAKISFKMDSFQAFVLMQETYANLPFQSWELRPLGQDSALFTVNGALIDLSITIQGNQCMLQSEQERGLAHLIGKWMSGPALQRAMLSAGINIFVNEYTDKYVSTCSKDPLTEHAAYEQMALFASACAFSWSKWNAKCGAEHLVMQVCEHHGPAPVPKGSWSLYLLGAQRSQKLEITEKSEVFSPDHYPGSEFHSTFIHMLQDNMSTDGIATTRESNYLFVDTVQSLLCATRPLMYS
uniref:Dynein axonemal intermediate chain 7 n=1 Tax=Dicentrarchus labrax TaxID=13489 RepID=A0A8C4I662_DICLA